VDKLFQSVFSGVCIQPGDLLPTGMKIASDDNHARLLSGRRKTQQEKPAADCAIGSATTVEVARVKVE
jgi:hypothetical protein